MKLLKDDEIHEKYRRYKEKTSFYFGLLVPPFVVFCIVVIHFLIIIIVFTTFPINIRFFKWFNLFTQIIICLFLLIRFQPFKLYNLQKYDSFIIFFCASYLLVIIISEKIDLITGTVEILKRIPFFGDFANKIIYAEVLLAK